MPTYAFGIRRLLRPIAGREQPIWKTFGTPALRYAAFRDPVDTALFSLIQALPSVRFLQIGSNDGRTNDPLWAFRRYPNWQGVFVEPLEQPYGRLLANYAGLNDSRFRFVQAAIGRESGIRDFHHLRQVPEAPAGSDQLGSLDAGRVIAAARSLGLGETLVSKTPVQSLTFLDLRKELGLDRLDVVHVDAEGSDGEIVRQIERSGLRPHLLLYEHTFLSGAEGRRLADRLAAAGYVLHAMRHDTLCLLNTSAATIPGLRFLSRRLVPG